MCGSFFLLSGKKLRQYRLGFVGLLLLPLLSSCVSLSSPPSSSGSTTQGTESAMPLQSDSPTNQQPTYEQLIEQNKMQQQQIAKKDALLTEWIERWDKLKQPQKTLIDKVQELTTSLDVVKKASEKQHQKDQAVIDAQAKVITDKDDQVIQAQGERDIARTERDKALKSVATAAGVSAVLGLATGALLGSALKTKEGILQW